MPSFANPQMSQPVQYELEADPIPPNPRPMTKKEYRAAKKIISNLRVDSDGNLSRWNPNTTTARRLF
jgi:hypothetical protein